MRLHQSANRRPDAAQGFGIGQVAQPGGQKGVPGLGVGLAAPGKDPGRQAADPEFPAERGEHRAGCFGAAPQPAAAGHRDHHRADPAAGGNAAGAARLQKHLDPGGGKSVDGRWGKCRCFIGLQDGTGRREAPAGGCGAGYFIPWGMGAGDSWWLLRNSISARILSAPGPLGSMARYFSQASRALAGSFRS